MEKITSVHNQRVKNWKKLQTKRQRIAENLYLLDGWHLVQEALRSHVPLRSIIGTEAVLAEHADDLQTVPSVFTVTEEVMNHITETVTPQGILAEVELPADQNLMPEQLNGAWLLLDQVQDPGNIGTMVRTADAAGFTGVVAGTKTADLFSPKVVRSMQGSQFHLQLKHGPLPQWIEQFKALNLPVFGTELNVDAVPYNSITPQQNFGLVMGNEGNGVSADILGQTTQNLFIPMAGKAESLNVAVSAGIIMFQIKKN